MITEFYLVNQSFRYPESVTIEQLEYKIKLLSEDYLYIRQYKETDKIFVHPSVYEECIFEKLTIYEMLYTRKGKQFFDKDIRDALSIIIDRSEETAISVEEVIEVLLPEHDEKVVHGLLCLHNVEAIDPIYLVYDKNNWLAFHRHFLGLYPKNVPHYFKECTKYFPDLYFHQRNQKTLAALFPNFVKKVIFHLAALNDEFRYYQNDPYQRIETLKAFSVGCNLDKEASTEGNSQRKSDFTFDFLNKRNVSESICCEPHLKLCKSDSEGDSTFYFHRIYFHEGKENIEEARILIGHIGKHL